MPRTAYSVSDPVIWRGTAQNVQAIGPSNGVALLTTDLTLNNTVTLFKVSKGFNLIRIRGYITDCDTNGTPTLQFTLGDAGSANRFLAATTIGQTGGFLPEMAASGFNYKFAADTDIIMTVTAAAATAAAGTLTVFFEGWFD